VAQAEHFYSLAEASEDFKPRFRPRMSAICLRYERASSRLAEKVMKHLHKHVATHIESAGRFWISTTVLKGQWCFRVNPVTFRTRLARMDELFTLLQAECAQALASRLKRSDPHEDPPRGGPIACNHGSPERSGTIRGEA